MTEEHDMSTPVREDAPKAQLSLLDRLRQKAQEDTTNPEVRIVIPKRPEVSILVSPNLEDWEVKKLQESATHKGKFDAFKFALGVVAHTTRGIFLDDEEVRSEAGHPLTFASPEIREMFGSQGTPQLTVKEAFGVDAHVIAAAGKIVDLAGYGDEVETEDPTKAS
jgi:hypothetical protein